MYEILEKRKLNEITNQLWINAPYVARKCEPGQFLILRVHPDGERVPFTIMDWDREEGKIAFCLQRIGASTTALSELKVGDCLNDLVGPMGRKSPLDGTHRVAVVGGGLGCAISYPQAKYLHEKGVEVDLIAGFRNKDLIILEEEMKAVSTNLYIVTDDGSNGKKALVTEVLKERIDAGRDYDLVIVSGPIVMMKFCSETTRPYGIHTIVTMNTLVVDGTGMCGGCRLTVGGETKFACVDGPDFNGHEVDFDEAIARTAMYRDEEQKIARHREEHCNLMKMEVK